MCVCVCVCVCVARGSVWNKGTTCDIYIYICVCVCVCVARGSVWKKGTTCDIYFSYLKSFKSKCCKLPTTSKS